MKEALGNNPSFLIVKASSLGDIIHCFPTLDYLCQRFPGAQVDWIVERSFASLVQAHPLVRRALLVDTRTWRRKPWARPVREEWAHFRSEVRSSTYDVAFDLQGNLKSGILLSQARAKCKVGFAQAPEWPNTWFTTTRYSLPEGEGIRQDYLNLVRQHVEPGFSNPFQERPVQLQISDEDQQKIYTVLKDPILLGGESCALICPGSAWVNKKLEIQTLKRFLEIWKEREDVRFLLAWGSEAERQEAAFLQQYFPNCSLLIERFSLPVLQNLMAQVDTVLAMDSLPLHLCATTATPSFSVFGASSAKKYKPSGEQHRAYQGKCPEGKTFEKRCPILRRCSHGACIRSMQANELFQDFWEWYTKRSWKIGYVPNVIE